MSEYQYYEFCRINELISREARKEMASLSSRTHIGTHGVSYVYNYGSFKGDPKQLLLKYFDVFFYISNFGSRSIRLMFKYSNQQADVSRLNKYCIKHIIDCEKHGQDILLDVCVNSGECGGWVEGEGLLPDLLPLYEEIRSKDYRFLDLVLAISKVSEKSSGSEKRLRSIVDDVSSLSFVQQSFLDCVAIDSL